MKCSHLPNCKAMLPSASPWSPFSPKFCRTTAARSRPPAKRLDQAVEMAKNVLTDWGYAVAVRPEGEKVSPLGDASLNKRDYETQRPSEEEAPREGDVRFFPKFQ